MKDGGEIGRVTFYYFRYKRYTHPVQSFFQKFISEIILSISVSVRLYSLVHTLKV